MADLKDLFKEAAEIADAAPKDLRKIAYERALDELLKKNESSKGSSVDKKKKATSKKKPVKNTSSNSKAKKPPKPDEVVQKAIDQIDSTKYPKIYKLEKAFDKSVYILKIAKEVLKIDGLGTTQIARILTDKFRIKTTAQSVDMAIKRSPDKVNKIGAKYQIMHAGEKHIASVLDGIEKE